MSYSFDQTDVKYMYLALFYKTAYLSAMSRLIRSDYRAVTECIAKAFSIFRFNQSFLDKKMHSEQKRLSDI